MKMKFIKDKLKNLNNYPGVYQMLDINNKVIYIGKASNLKKRVASYFNKEHKDIKTKTLVAKIKNFEVIVTNTEVQALLLENQLIKQHQPKYNVLLKDSKSYPYICITNDKHPRVSLHRGNKNKNYQFFGPYPSAHVVRESLILLKKIFKVRQCSNGVYRSRSRPCLEYQINFCSAPCVGKISDENYKKDVEMMKLFLNSKGEKILKKISDNMQLASKNLNFELAAHYRDQLIKLRTIQEQNFNKSINDLDVISIVQKDSICAVEILFIRSNKQIAQECIFPKNTKEKSLSEILSAFLPLYYLGKNIPKYLLVSEKLKDKSLIAKTLATNITDTPKKDRKKFLKIANLTAKQNLKQHLATKFNKNSQLLQLKKIFNLEDLPNYIECFDVSHTMGEATIASCVVFRNGIAKISDYRYYNIKEITPGDDYAAIKQVVYRRYLFLTKNNKNLPDIVFIDGGLGQLKQAIIAIKSLNITKTKLVAIAKGENRKAGLETLITIEDDKTQKINLPMYNKALLLINNIRDESHRFAIKNHRKKRAKTRKTSSLESIYGIGENRRKALINYFGGLQEIKKASIEELQKVKGINATLANKMITNFKGNI